MAKFLTIIFVIGIALISALTLIFAVVGIDNPLTWKLN